MKKLLIIAAVMLFAHVPTAWAISCGVGGTCKSSCASTEMESMTGSTISCQSTPLTGKCCVVADRSTGADSCQSGYAFDATAGCIPIRDSTIGSSGTDSAAATPSNSSAKSQTSGFVALAPIPGLTDQQPTQGGLAVFFNNLYKYLIGLAAALAVLQITWAGINIAYFHKDAVAAITDDKGKIYNAVIGLVLVLAPVLVFSIINPSILNLSFNIPALDTKTGATASNSNGTSASPTTTDTKTGCSVTGGDYFKTISCSSQAAANGFNCGSGLSLRVLACKSTDAGTGKCLDKTSAGYCTGKSTTLEFYQYYRSYVGVLFGDALPTPRDAAARDSFASACQKDGGKVSYSITTASKAFIASHAYQASVATNGCATDSGVVFDSSKGGGVACFNEVVSCESPN